jgi:hypothetical protein
MVALPPDWDSGGQNTVGPSGVCMASPVQVVPEPREAVRHDQSSRHHRLYEWVIADANDRPATTYSGMTASAKGVKASHLATNDVKAGAASAKFRWGRTALAKE